MFPNPITPRRPDTAGPDPCGPAPAATRRVAVIGAGAWGTTLAAMACANGPTTLWAREADVVDAVLRQRQNPRFLPDVTLPLDLGVTEDVALAVSGADIVVMAVPAQHVRATAAQASRWIGPDALVVSATKGIELGTARRMSEVLADELRALRPGRCGVLAGPNLAREVAAGHPSATTVAFADEGAAATVQHRLSGPTFRVYTSNDVVGCEIGGAVKNVIAIAAGAAAGLGSGMNTMAALVTRGLAELSRLGIALGGDPLTFLGLAGNGDLVATCLSPLSRNHRVGRELARGWTIGEIVGGMPSVAEGVTTAPVALELARRHDVDMPIVAMVADLLDGRTSAVDAIGALMSRRPRPELHGLPAVVGPR